MRNELYIYIYIYIYIDPYAQAVERFKNSKLSLMFSEDVNKTFIVPMQQNVWKTFSFKLEGIFTQRTKD